MKKTIAAGLALVINLAIPATGREKSKQQVPLQREQKVVQAVRASAPVSIDAELDEPVWKGPASNGFTQSDPNDGSPATERTDVWVAYDDKALYVAAFCHDSDPRAIISRLGRRDDEVDSDWFVFAVDPYYDRQTGYRFGVNPGGSIMDQVLSNDVDDDESWDGVWEAKAHVNDSGWTLEMKIPFHQIRFPKKSEYVWGVNFQRIIKRKNETASFAWVPKNETGYVSRFARLEGIQGIKPGTHLEILPYAVGQTRLSPTEQGNPFEPGHKTVGNLGFDLKFGLKSNLTLDATVNPDFGQVEVDPAVVNLSAYETFYEEKRPFFIEGASIFNGFGRGGMHMNFNINWPNPTFFYSRRIGRAPQGYITQPGDHFALPDRTTILGAAKVTGKLGGWNVGFVNALTSREFAQIDASGLRLREEMEPLTYYGVLRAQKDIEKGQRGFGLLATGVSRDLRTEALSGLLNKNAFSLALDGWSFLDEKRSYVIAGWFGGTRVEGSAADMLRLQNSSMHYFQRPDASHVEVDPQANSLSGWGARLSFAKQGGNVLFNAAFGALSPGFDPNDIGYQFMGSDKINYHVIPGYSWTKPGKVFQQVVILGGVFGNYDFEGNKIWEGGLFLIDGTFRNFWRFNTMLAYNPRTVSNTLTRGGPLALIPWGWQVDFQLETDSRRPIVLEGSSTVYTRPDFGQEWSVSSSLRWKPGSNLSLSAGPILSHETNPIQWVRNVPDPLMTATLGSRYVFGHIDQRLVAAEVRLNWTFTPRLTLQAYVQPFVAVGRYDRFKELARTKSLDYNFYGEGGSTIAYADGGYTVDPDGSGPAAAFSFGDPNFNVKSLRGTIVLRWEYLPGSLLYFVWTQNRADYAHPGDFRLGRDLGDLLTAPGDNIFLVKFSYRWSL